MHVARKRRQPLQRSQQSESLPSQQRAPPALREERAQHCTLGRKRLKNKASIAQEKVKK